MFSSGARTVDSLTMLRKVLWSGIYAGLAAGAAMIARTVATKLWTMSTGEEPPAKR